MDSSGTSAYMLFYERKQKKDLNIITEEEKLEAPSPVTVKRAVSKGDKIDNIIKVPFKNAADREKANSVYREVFDENLKFTFENEVYSHEFLDFVANSMSNLA